MKPVLLLVRGGFPAIALLIVAGCKSAYYETWERLGRDKRHILVGRIAGARDDQEAAKRQFQTTLARFQEVAPFQGGELEARYRKLRSEYESCEARARDVNKRIHSVDIVASDLFAEWEDELCRYETEELRRASEDKLRESRSRYGQLIAVMRTAASRMPPVLRVFEEQVLFLKHNLNAHAVASLYTTTAGVEADVARLVLDVNAAIAEANQYLAALQ